MQHTTIGNTTTFYSTTEESRINKSVSAANIKFLVKFTNEFSKNFIYAYAQNQNINNRFTSFDINHGTSEDILTGTVNLSPAGYWSYEIFEISFVGTPSLTDSTVPLDENTILAPSDDNGINNGLIEIGKVLSSETTLGKEVTYLESESPADDSYIYPYADSGVSNVVNGCTDINANNYNANATNDDGTCAYHVYGCIDVNANNFNSAATIDNGTCTFDVSGCTDSTAANYNALATVDDGSCTHIVYGCTDINANNYDSTATNDDGTCTFDIPGCTDSTATNYDSTADVDDGSCEYAADLNFTFSVNTATAGYSGSNQFQLPFVSVGFTAVDVDWGDGNTTTVTSLVQAQLRHTYASSGIYTIKISGVVNAFQFAGTGDKNKINVVSNCGQLNLNTALAFNGCTNLTWTATDAPTINTTTLAGTFRDCPAFDGNINNWDVSGVSNFFAFLYLSNSFTGPLDGWDIGSATNLSFFGTGINMTTPNYDALLVSWEGQSPNTGLNPNFGTSRFSLGSAADTAQSSLRTTYSWGIIDSGGI
jgi:hypothetical protein